jgi:hypothetical protein
MSDLSGNRALFKPVTAATSSPSRVPAWMTRLLWFVGGYNLLAGVGMVCFYHEGYKLLGIEKPQLNLPIQLVGILVGLFGVGYWMVAADPPANRNILLLGFWSKALGSLLGTYYVCVGYLPPFYVILRRLKALTPPDTGRVLE